MSTPTDWTGYIMVVAEDNRPALYIHVKLPLGDPDPWLCVGCGRPAHYLATPLGPQDEGGQEAFCNEDMLYVWNRRYTGEWNAPNHDPADYWMYPPAK